MQNGNVYCGQINFLIPHPFSGESSSGNHFRHGKEKLRKRNTSHQKEENHDIKKMMWTTLLEFK